MGEDKKLIEKRIIDAAVEIRHNVALEVVYQHGIFCQVALPRSKPEGSTFERSFKNASIKIRAGELWDGRKWVEQSIPYGPKPRLALIHFNSEAVRTGNPVIEIGRSCAAFLRDIGLPDQDGRTYNLFKRQMMALAAAELKIGFTVDRQAVTLDAKPIKEFRAWLANDDKQEPLWPGYLELSQEYFENLKAHAVPLDPRALSALSHSALALDIYSWLGRRLHTLSKPVKVAFPHLKEQFGQEYTGEKADDHFKEKFLKMTKQVLAVYPDANVVQVTGGLILNPSKPPVRKTIMLIQGHRNPKQEPLPLLRPPQQPNLTPLTIERFRGLYAGLDPYACQGDFDSWLSGKDNPPVNYDRAFLGFARKWAKGKR
jgi:hypothetical protein